MIGRSWKQIAFLGVVLIAVLACGGTVPPTVPAATVPASAVPTGAETAVPVVTAPLEVETAVPPTVPTGAGGPISIGMEYVLIDNEARAKRQAGILAEIGATAVKPLGEHIEWGVMQTGPNAAIDFQRLDTFVREYQAVGFRDLVVTLKSHSSWASVNHSLLNSVNAAPKPEYMSLYETWIGSVVERYDGDGVDDMPGLLLPVRYYEIGTEFSSYEPGPVEDYIEMLSHAYTAAHGAYDDVLIAHVAFLTASVFTNNPTPAEYETAWANAYPPTKVHSLADHRAILDRPDIFDLINIHSLTDPYEIEDIVAWLNYETDQRGYRKPIIVSDTITTPFIAYGPATVCDRPPNAMGLVFQPATEEDRCRLADYFTKLVDGDEETLRWTQGFAAADTVKRAVVAAEQGIVLINMAFTEDLVWLKLPVVQAGAGTSAWAGFVDMVTGERRASFYAMKQLVGYLGSYQSIRRLPFEQPGARIYEIQKEGETVWVAWYEPGHVVLPGEAIPELTVQLAVGQGQVVVEPVIIAFNQTEGLPILTQTVDGLLTLTLTPQPVYIYP